MEPLPNAVPRVFFSCITGMLLSSSNMYRTVNLGHVSAHSICIYCLPAGDLCYLDLLMCEGLVRDTKQYGYSFTRHSYSVLFKWIF